MGSGVLYASRVKTGTTLLWVVCSAYGHRFFLCPKTKMQTTQMETNPPNATGVQIFNNPQFGEIRTAEFNGLPFFVANDVCKCLGYSKPRNAISQHVDAEDALKQGILTKGGIQETVLINESGVYSLVFGSKLETAKQFKKWVTSEVLPAIRKSGGYILSQPEETPDVIMARALRVADETLRKNAMRVKELESEIKDIEFKLQATEGEKQILAEQNQRMLPKAEYTDQILQSTDTYTFTQVAKSLNLRSVYVLEKILQEKKVIYKQSGQWMPYTQYAGKGYFSTRTHKYFKSDGSVGTNISTVITERGRAWIHYTFFKPEAQA